MFFCFKKDKIPTKLKPFFEVQGMICKNVFVSLKLLLERSEHKVNMIYKNFKENLKS